MPCSLGVIGLGRMAQAIISPLIERGEILPEDIFAVVGTVSTVKRLSKNLPQGLNLVSSDDPTASNVWDSRVQLLAVKPQQLEEVVNSAPKASSGKVVDPVLISLLAGVRLNRLQTLFPRHVCVRAVPNLPVCVGEGLTGLSWENKITERQRLDVKKLFLSVSEIIELPESQMDAFLALASSGPAYIALIAEALADGAVAAGLPRYLASRIASRTLAGTASLLSKNEVHPAKLKDMVCSPAGTTIAGLREIEKAGIRSALIEAIICAAKKSSEIGED